MKSLSCAPAFLAILLVLSISASSFGQNQDLGKKLSLLDINDTCATEVQKKIAIKSLQWFEAYEKEDLDAQLALFANNFKLFHTALTRFALLNPTLAPYLKWSAAPLTRENYRATLAQLIDGEDQSQPGDRPVSVFCAKEKSNENVVIVSVIFKGFKTTRDKVTGCITHRADYQGPATKIFVFDRNLKIAQHIVDFDGRLADEARAKLAFQASEPVIPQVDATCRTAAQTNKQYGVAVPTNP